MGQTWSLAHLAPFVQASRIKWREKVLREFDEAGLDVDFDKMSKIAEDRVRDEVKAGIQTIQYQLLTLMTTNGQTPFVSVCLDLHESPEGQERDDLALLIDEMLTQREQGIKDPSGAWITPAFPKLLYVLHEDNRPDHKSKYSWLTEHAARCTAKRMVPDYISSKIMQQEKGDTYACMGCRSFLTPDEWSLQYGNIANAGNFEKYKGHVYYGRLTKTR